jgi:transcriptional regulator GlxA family with amidase domain
VERNGAVVPWLRRWHKRGAAIASVCKQATGDTPLIYLQKVRVAAAKLLLENDHRVVQEISEAVGYQDVAFFRQIFERHKGASPSAYRRRFGVNAA